MAIVDADYILRVLVKPQSPNDIQMTAVATDLLSRVEKGSESIFLSDAVLAEIFLILSSRRHYDVGRRDVVDRLTPILNLSGCHLDRKRAALDALMIWVNITKISFVDALGAAAAIELEQPLATFDEEMGKIPGSIRRHSSLIKDNS